MYINAHNVHQNGGKKTVTPPTLIALAMAVSFLQWFPPTQGSVSSENNFPPTQGSVSSENNFGCYTGHEYNNKFCCMLVSFLQPTGGLVDICEDRKRLKTTKSLFASIV